MSDETLLARAAQAYGIELCYYDTWGRAHQASPEVLRALLGSLGFAAGSDQEIEKGLAARETAERRRQIDPIGRTETPIARQTVTETRAGSEERRTTKRFAQPAQILVAERVDNGDGDALVLQFVHTLLDRLPRLGHRPVVDEPDSAPFRTVQLCLEHPHQVGIGHGGEGMMTHAAVGEQRVA